jgi:hypothetical protein
MEPDDNSAPRQDRLALIELLGSDGRVAQTFSVCRWPVTLGRGLSNHVVLDDPHVAAHHATLNILETGQVALTVGDSVNGVTHAGQHHGAGADVVLPTGAAALQLGGLQLRLRLAGETLAAERPLPRLRATSASGPWAAGLGFMLLALFNHWVSLDPGAEASAWTPLVVGIPVALAGWSGLWALASKLFQHRFDFMGHLRIVLPWLLGIELVELALNLVASTWGWAWLWRSVGPLQVLLGVLLLRAHLVHMLPLAQRALGLSLTAMTLVGAGIHLTTVQRATDRFSRPAYMSSLPQPWLHRANTGSSQDLIQELAPLAQQLALRAQKARKDEPAGGEDTIE